MGASLWLTNEVVRIAGLIKRGDVAVLLHTTVLSKGVSNTAGVTKIGGINLKFDIIDGTLIVVA